MAGARHRGEKDEQQQHLLISDAESEEPEDLEPAEQDSDQPAISGACGRCFVALLDPRTLVYRYVLIAILCLAKICLVYSVEMPAALERIIINVMRVDTTQYELLYSLYFWPNVFLLVIGGILLDRVFGLRLGLIFFATVACLGQLLFAMGGYFNLFWLMVVGRFLYGCGVELASTTSDIFIAALFMGSELSFLLGLVFGASRVSSTLNLNLSPSMYEALNFSDLNVRLGSVLLIGFGLCLIGLVLTCTLTALDHRRERVLKNERGKHEQFKLKDLKDFSLSFWLITSVGLLYYIPLFPFVSIAQVFFEQKFAYRAGMANLVNGFLFLIPAFAYPLFGLIFDWTGYKLYWGMFSILGTQACHFALAFAGPEYFLPILSTLCLGLFNTTFTSSVWPQVFLLLQEHQLATAYGITYASYELGQALAAIIVGAIVDASGYVLVELFFIGVLSLTLMLLVALYIVDTTYGGQKLNMSGRRRRIMTRLKEQEERIAVAQLEKEPVTEELQLVTVENAQVTSIESELSQETNFNG